MQPSPFLMMLLNRKRNDPSIYNPKTIDPNIPYDDPNDPIEPSPDEMGPTIALRTQRQPMDERMPNGVSSIAPPSISLGQRPAPAQQPAQQPTVPVTTQPNAPVVPAATIRVNPRGPGSVIEPRDDVIARDRQAIIDAQAKHHSRARDILEGLGQWAGAGLGLNVHRLIYPHGTAEEQAQGQLATDVELQKAQTENQDRQSTIALRSAQARKIEDDLKNPDTSEADRRKLILAQEILRSHPQPFDPNDPADVIAKKKLEDAGIPVPASYGKQPKVAGPHNPLLRDRKNPDGTTSTMQSDDFGKTWKEAPDLTSNPPPTERGAETPEQLATRRRNFTASQSEYNAIVQQGELATKKKESAWAEEAKVKSAYDAGTATKQELAEATKNREKAQAYYESFGAKKDTARAKIIQYADGLDANGEPIAPKGQAPTLKTRGAPGPTTYNFSISNYIQRNKGATEADARAYAQKNYKGYSVVP